MIVYFILDTRTLPGQLLDEDQFLDSWLRSISEFARLDPAKSLVSVCVVVENGFKVYRPLGLYTLHDLECCASQIRSECGTGGTAGKTSRDSLPEMLTVFDQDAAVGCLEKVAKHITFFCSSGSTNQRGAAHSGSRQSLNSINSHQTLLSSDKRLMVCSASVGRLLPYEAKIRTLCCQELMEVSASLEISYVFDADSLAMLECNSCDDDNLTEVSNRNSPSTLSNSVALDMHTAAQQLALSLCDVENFHFRCLLVDDGSVECSTRELVARMYDFTCNFIIDGKCNSTLTTASLDNSLEVDAPSTPTENDFYSIARQSTEISVEACAVGNRFEVILNARPVLLAAGCLPLASLRSSSSSSSSKRPCASARSQSTHFGSSSLAVWPSQHSTRSISLEVVGKVPVWRREYKDGGCSSGGEVARGGISQHLLYGIPFILWKSSDNIELCLDGDNTSHPDNIQKSVYQNICATLAHRNEASCTHRHV